MTMVAGAHLLVVDDDTRTRELLRRFLVEQGYRVATAADAAEAETQLDALAFDLVVLDVMLPGEDGIAFTKRLRAAKRDMPIVLLTARGETADRISGLASGADDYLPKPFDLDELLARLRALLRRAKPDTAEQSGEPLQISDLRIDPTSRRVWRGQREVELSKTEFDLLELLVRNQGIVLEHSTIYDRIWGYDFGPDSKNLAVYISYLRRKLEGQGDSKVIHTVRGVGYTVRAA